MCQSLAEGGQRCAAHTRPRYQTAPFGTPEWDAAAAAYASTPTGRMELQTSLAAAEAAGDVRSAVAFEHALSEGSRLREKAELFREALAERAAPAMEEPAPQPVDEFEDLDFSDFEEEYGGRSYTDEEAWENSEYRDWTPSMVGSHWNHADPVFSGCAEEMTENQFIDQVCDNVGVTRAEFEAAAADYLAANRVALVMPGANVGYIGSPAGTHSAEDLRTLVIDSAVPHFTPEQIKAIAEMAREQRAQRETAPAPGPEAPEDTTAGTPAPTARRYTRRRLPHVPDGPAALAALAQGNDALMREAVAAHANTPAETLARLATSDAKVEVRAAAARNENLPVDTLTSLVADRSVKVRAGAARNPSMPVAHLTRLAEDANDSVVGAVGRNPSAPADLYERISRHGSAGVRKHAARRKDIPDNIARSLADDVDQTVRTTLARNRTTTEYILRGLVTDPEQSVRAAAAKNPNLPSALLRGRLSRDPAPGVRAAVARNENTSRAVLTRLSTDTDPWVRRNVAWNQTTPAVLLYALANDADENVRNAARNRNTQQPAA